MRVGQARPSCSAALSRNTKLAMVGMHGAGWTVELRWQIVMTLDHQLHRRLGRLGWRTTADGGFVRLSGYDMERSETSPAEELLEPARFRELYDRALPVVYGYMLRRCVRARPGGRRGPSRRGPDRWAARDGRLAQTPVLVPVAGLERPSSQGQVSLRPVSPSTRWRL